MSPKSNYSDFMQSIQPSSNVNIICKNNVCIKSHKILLILCGDFIRELLEDFPAADHVTLFLPDCEAEQVDTSLKNILLKEPFSENCPLISIFGKKSTSSYSQDLPEEKPRKYKKATYNSKRVFHAEDIDYQSETFKVDEDDDEIKTKAKQPKTPNRKSDYKPRNVDFDQLKSKLIPNPQSREDIKHNDIIEKQILHERAIEAYIGGDESLSKIGQQFGVKKSTLCKLLKCDKKFSGKGNKSQLFTEDEEKTIAEKALARIKTGSGDQMNLSSLRELLEHELTRLRPLQRQSGTSVREGAEINKSFVRRFAIRNKLERYMFQKYTLSEKRKFECDICNKSFTLKCSLVTHQKQIHFSFLHSNDT